jgi:hypothetical protein
VKTFIFEATQKRRGGFNHGKFLAGVFEEHEWAQRCILDGDQGLDRSLVARCGWSRQHVWVLDLATGEGACFRHGGLAKADLDRHQIHVCVLFEAFLTWLYRQPLETLGELSTLVTLPDVEPDMYGYRRPGPQRLEDAG